MPTVVTGNADGANVFLNGRADNIADRPMIPEVNNLNPVPNEFQIDRIDGAVVSVANRDGGKDADW